MIAAGTLLAAQGCAVKPVPAHQFAVQIGASLPEVAIVGAKTSVAAYGLVIHGSVRITPGVAVPEPHSVDIDISGPDGKQIRKFTSQYFPTPRAGRPKPQNAHFTTVMAEPPPAGSVIRISLTPPPPPEHALPPPTW